MDGPAATWPPTLAVTVGLTLLFFGLVNSYIWTPTARVVPQFFGFGGFTFLGVQIDWEEVITVGAAVAIAVGLRLFLYQTRTGIAMRGVVDNRSLIGLFGGRPTRLSTLSWSIGASLASVAGILVAPRLQLQPLILTLLVIDAYAAAVIGRLRSLPMTFLGALIVGLASSYAVGYVPSTGLLVLDAGAGDLTLSVPSIILFIALLTLPMHRIRSGAPQRHAPAGAGRLRALPAGRGPARRRGLAWPCRSWARAASSSWASGWPSGSSACRWSRSPAGAATSRICQLTFAGLGAYAMYRFGSGGSLLGLAGGGRPAPAPSAPSWRCPPCACAASTWPWPPWPSPPSWTTRSSRGRPSSASTARSPSTSPTSSAST